jgi:hypothetical protein
VPADAHRGQEDFFRFESESWLTPTEMHLTESKNSGLKRHLLDLKERKVFLVGVRNTKEDFVKVVLPETFTERIALGS